VEGAGAGGARVGKLVALTDGLQLAPGELVSCFETTSDGITLSFLGHAHGPVLATVSEPNPYCGGMPFTIRGKDEPALDDPGSFATDVLAIAGVRWPGFNRAD
jgi:hypothetical protein